MRVFSLGGVLLLLAVNSWFERAAWAPANCRPAHTVEIALAAAPRILPRPAEQLAYLAALNDLTGSHIRAESLLVFRRADGAAALFPINRGLACRWWVVSPALHRAVMFKAFGKAA